MGGLGGTSSLSPLCLWIPVFIGVAVVCVSVNVSAELQRLEHPAVNKADASSISFLVIGEWGRKGTYNQSRVAFQMGRVGDKLNIDFVVSTGDNFYDDGLTVLGNHDYRGDVEAQLNPFLHDIDHRWFCQRSFILHTEIAEFFFVDTTPFVDKYFSKPKDHKYDWSGVLPRDKYFKPHKALRDSTAKWKIVVGHHPVRSIGHHGDTKELLTHLLPILEVNNVDMYLNGHDHCLEHISSTSSQIQFLTSGGGSKAWKGDVDKNGKDGVKFYYDGQGFMSVELEQMNVKVVYYNVFGKVLHVLNLSKGLHYAI
ncbi:hypothetical protein TSUD_72660 [Trifolium subterraneum]|uniref:Purple acid phosphatase n=1 Tax=Trifolium subterraneum TaxID=3900 RepID=A0A2Z6M2K0_TRISU|nr:hypothetical protein TSUD_72660 [Trifolium subterraneum]